MSTTLIDLGLIDTLYVTSILQFTPSNELLPANITCNDQMRTVRIKGKEKFNLELRQHTSLMRSSMSYEKFQFPRILLKLRLRYHI